MENAINNKYINFLIVYFPLIANKKKVLTPINTFI